VLVGVDRYARADIPDLHGCENDVRLVWWLLRRYFGVANVDIRVLLNDRATRDRILDRVGSTLAASEPGDLAVFYYSGHGSQVRDRDGDELRDSLDEVLCPYDLDWDRGTFITDDCLARLFALAPPDVVVESFFDCCFWGAGEWSAARAQSQATARPGTRYLVPPFDIAARAKAARPAVSIGRIVRPFHGTSVTWAAAGEGQPATEEEIDGRVQGLFTYWGCRTIADTLDAGRRPRTSRAQLLAELRGRVAQAVRDQIPELAATAELSRQPPLSPRPARLPWEPR
jgi:hypothetical protein